jgi:hypothetical protein
LYHKHTVCRCIQSKVSILLIVLTISKPHGRYMLVQFDTSYIVTHVLDTISNLHNAVAAPSQVQCFPDWLLSVHSLICLPHIMYINLKGHCSFILTQLVEALRHKPEGCGFDSRWCQNF